MKTNKHSAQLLTLIGKAETSVKVSSRSSVTSTFLPDMLELAVPLWIDQLQVQSWEHIQERSRICSQYIAEKGDVILFRSDKKGETAEAFNRLAEGVACLAFAPGGVTAFGNHYEGERIDEVPEPATS